MKYVIYFFIVFIGIQSQAQEEASQPVAATVTSAAASESEILVKLDGKKAPAETQESGMKLLLTFSILGVLGCGGYFLIRKYRFSNLNASRANEIKVLTQHHLGPKRSIAVVRVAGESMLIGITDHNINLLKNLSLLDDDIPETTPRKFDSVFDSETGQVNTGIEDEFSISGIKDFVSKRLKNMRNIH